MSAADEQLSRRLLAEYGALFVASPGVMVPPVCVFGGEDEVQEFQRRAGWSGTEIAGALIELQPAAMEALLAARKAATEEGLDITPRGGAEAGRRSFADTVRLWDSRYLPALAYWSSWQTCHSRGGAIARPGHCSANRGRPRLGRAGTFF
ncbi:MAG: hypothetical protein WKF30_02555 [Pyrinomonadaceae bacterium]